MAWILDETSLECLADPERRQMVTGTRDPHYSILVAFVMGLYRAGPDSLDGFKEFITVTISKKPNLHWANSVLDLALTDDEIWEVLSGAGSDEANERANTALVEALEGFGRAREGGSIDHFKDEYQTLARNALLLPPSEGQ